MRAACPALVHRELRQTQLQCDEPVDGEPTQRTIARIVAHFHYKKATDC
jgi:hypothetical protein